MAIEPLPEQAVAGGRNGVSLASADDRNGSIALCNRRLPADFRYAPLATEITRRRTLEADIHQDGGYVSFVPIATNVPQQTVSIRSPRRRAIIYPEE